MPACYLLINQQNDILANLLLDMSISSASCYELLLRNPGVACELWLAAVCCCLLLQLLSGGSVDGAAFLATGKADIAFNWAGEQWGAYKQ